MDFVKIDAIKIVVALSLCWNIYAYFKASTKMTSEKICEKEWKLKFKKTIRW